MYYFVRGGRTGKKIHRATSGSSCLDCGHWTRHSVLAFAEGPLTRETRDSLVARGARFCEKCFPRGPEGIGFERIAVAAAHHFKPGERVVEKASKRRGTVNRIEEKGENSIVVVIFDDRLAKLNARPPEKRLGVVPVEAVSPWALRKLSTKEAKEEEARSEKAKAAPAPAPEKKKEIELRSGSGRGFVLRVGDAIRHIPTAVRMTLEEIDGDVLRFDTGSLEAAYIEARIGEYEAADFTKDDAIRILWGSSHSILSGEGARKIARAFELPEEKIPFRTFTDSRSEHKGVTLDNRREGEKAAGLVDALDLARSLCGFLGLETGCPYFGRGRNMETLVGRIAARANEDKAAQDHVDGIHATDDDLHRLNT